IGDPGGKESGSGSPHPRRHRTSCPKHFKRCKTARLSGHDHRPSAKLLLVGHLTGTSPFLHELESASDWFARTSSGTAEWMAASVGTLATGSSFAGPLEGCRLRVPGPSGGREPFEQPRQVGGDRKGVG